MLLEDGVGVTGARLRYRRDIDGLRGLAVLLVVASHLGLRRFDGGYVGVDVFFVISGYLISSIILPQIIAGTFSFREFYLRRIRRIYPALLVMLSVTTVLAWHYLLPFDMREYAQALLSSTFGFSNLANLQFFGYFAPEAHFNPLQHTWSLGVEEQFYLFLPVALVFGVWALGVRRMRLWVGGLALLSFIAACIVVQWKAGKAFYQPHLRAWELLTGVFLSQPGAPKLRQAWQRNTASLCGLGMIVFCVLQYAPYTLFPGLAALPVCLGAALIIAAGETGSSAVGWLLELRPVVFVGLISYSLYLWHWPIQVFWNYGHVLEIGQFPSRASKVFVLIASFVAATISWRYIELPFRRRGTVRTNHLLIGACLCMALLAECAVKIDSGHGNPERWPAQVVKISDYMDVDIHPDPGRWHICEFAGQSTSMFRWIDFPSNEHFDAAQCLPFTPGKRHYLLTGDSHAAFLWWGLSHVFPDLQIGQAGTTLCGKFKNSLYSTDPTCAEVDHVIYDDLVPNHKVDTIIVSFYWSPDRIAYVTKLIEYAHRYGVEVIVVGPTDAYFVSQPRILVARLSHPGKSVKIAPWVRPLEPQIKRMARDVWKVRYISFYDDLCGTAMKCPLYAGKDIPLVWDEHHLSDGGSMLFAQSIKDHHQLP